MGIDVLRRQNVRWLCATVCACLCLSQLPRVEAQVSRTRDNQVRAAVQQAVELAYPAIGIDQLSISDRNDLNEDLSQITGKATPAVSFYSFDGMDSGSGDGSLWAVVLGDSPLDPDELYSFERWDSIEQSSQKFNRLLPHVAAPVSNEKAMRIARLYLGCCVRWAPGESVTGEGDLRHSVERFYIQVYGDVWRGLEVGTEWWESYEKIAIPLTPTVEALGGVRQIVLNRLVLSFGMHPQLQQWHVTVSADGSVRVLAVDSIFPKQRRWLSYAFRTSLAPQLH